MYIGLQLYVLVFSCMYCIYVGGVVDFGLIVVGKRTALELNYRVRCTYSSVCVCISVCVCLCVCITYYECGYNNACIYSIYKITHISVYIYMYMMLVCIRIMSTVHLAAC